MRIFLAIIFLTFTLFSCSENNVNNTVEPEYKTKITFVELGSDKCIPCVNMRPIMDSIQYKYGKQIYVKFIDVIRGTESHHFKIRLMPTQVFLDSNNVEIFRHEGFFAQDSIDMFLQSQGLIIINK